MKSSGETLQIFLCHSSGDKQAVRKLCSKLRADGFYPWLDEEELLPGQEWQLEIPKAVRSSHVVLVCLSCDSITKTGYVQKEIRYALDAADERPDGEIFIIPVKLSECIVPERLQKWHWVNLFDTSGYNKLLQTLLKKTSDLGLTRISPLRSSIFRQFSESCIEQAFLYARHRFPTNKVDSPIGVCFFGQPRSGKSSLINALTQGDYFLKTETSPYSRFPDSRKEKIIYHWGKDVILVDMPGIKGLNEGKMLVEIGRQIEDSEGISDLNIYVYRMDDFGNTPKYDDVLILDQLIQDLQRLASVPWGWARRPLMESRPLPGPLPVVLSKIVLT